MPFFNWALLKSRTLHPDIGIPADDTQGLPYLAAYGPPTFQNYGLAVTAISGTNSITGYLFTANTRYLVGSGEVTYIDANFGPSSMFAIDSLSGHVFAATASGIINNPISITGKRLGWTGDQSAAVLTCNPPITFFNYAGSKYVGFGTGEGTTFAIFSPGGVVKTYSNATSGGSLPPCTFYNGLYTIPYKTPNSGGQYGFISSADAPEIEPAFISYNTVSYSFTESALIFAGYNGDNYGYDGINDPALASSFIKLGLPHDPNEFFGVDPGTGRLLSISPNTVTVGGYVYYPVYVYNSVFPFLPSIPQQYARTVKNYTVNGHLNWRKQR